MKTIEWRELNAKLGVTKYPTTINQNHIIFQCEKGSILYSYCIPVAAWMEGKLYLGNKHDYSTTTNKYVKQFTSLTKKERNQWLKNEDATLFINY